MASVSQPQSNHLPQHRTPAPSTQPTAGTKHALTTAETKGAAPKHIDYTIKKGDTLTSISKAHKTRISTAWMKLGHLLRLGRSTDAGH